MKNGTVRTPNLLTFDIEGFVEACRDCVAVPPRYVSEELESEEIEINTREILNLLARRNQKATFFILGRIARDMPSLVRAIAEAGHEVACHSFHHRRLFYFQRPELARVLCDARRRLEDVSGKRVVGFRAPDFSITRKNSWAFDVLLKAGFEYDSSIVPTNLHDVYGIEDFLPVPFRMGNGLIEIPISTVKILAWRFPFGGGGYLRHYPLFLTKTFFEKANRQGIPVVVYFHPSEAGRVVRRIEEMSLWRKIRTYGGLGTALLKLEALIRAFPFSTVQDYLTENPVH